MFSVCMYCTSNSSLACLYVGMCISSGIAKHHVRPAHTCEREANRLAYNSACMANTNDLATPLVYTDVEEKGSFRLVSIQLCV